MAKKPTVTTLQSGFNSTEVLNTNFENVRDAFDNTLSLDGSTPNAMEADLDLNNNDILNANALIVNGSDVVATTAAALAAAQLAQTDADAAVVAAAASETAAALSETNAATSATTATTQAGISTTKAGESASSAAAALASKNAAALSETAAGLAELDAEAARDAAIVAKNAAEAVDVITNATATASTLSAGSSATASVTATNGTGAFSFGIPTGPQGTQGIQGIQGIQGPIADLYSENYIVGSTKPTATGANAIALGRFADASGDDSLSFGYGAESAEDGGVSIGPSAYAATINAVAIGAGAKTSTGSSSMALGLSHASGASSFSAQISHNALSYGATAASANAQGYLNKASGSKSLAIGGDSNIASAERSYALGNSSTASHADSMAFGHTATTSQNLEIALGGATNIVKVSGAYTLPQTDGTNGQVLTTDGSGAVTFAASGTGSGDLLAANNLSDLANAATARTNLGLGTAATTAATAYATSTQGTTADAALPKAGGALTGPVTTSSTFDGVDIAVRDGVLTTTTTTANAALPKAGGALTGAVTTNSTFDGRDVSVDGLKLDGIAAGATNTIGNATHTGEVTGSGALTIADNVVDEANLKVSNTPTNGYFLSAQSGNTGGLTWATVPAGYTDADVDTHLNKSTATTGEVLSWSGTDYDWIAAGGGGAALELYDENPSTPTAPSATGTNSVAIGSAAESSGFQGVALGVRAVAYGTGTKWNMTAFADSYASGTHSFAACLGNNASSYGAHGDHSIALGHTATASSNYSAALGGKAVRANASYSTAVGGLDNYVSGTRSITAGGQGNAVTGTYASVIGGRFNRAPGEYSSSSGYSANAGTYGKEARANGNFGGLSSPGDSQRGLVVLRSDTTDATAEALTANNSTASADNQVILPNNSAYFFSGTLIAREQASAGTDVGAWEIKGAIRREANAASTVLVKSTIDDFNVPTGWAVALTADTTNGGLAITVTGAASTNIRWVATVNTSEVTY